MPGMTAQEVFEFLGEPGHLVRIGSVDPEGNPLVVPTWFILEQDRFLVTPRERSSWFANLAANPQVCFTVDESVPPYRKVILRGSVQTIFPLGQDDAWRDLYRRITLRYVPPEWGDAYLADTHDEPRALLGLPISDATISTWRMPAHPGENPLAVWAPRYYHR